MLFERVRAVISKHIRFSEAWELDIAALWVLQAYITPSLPAVFYVFFSATKGKAKTTALDLLCGLTGGLNASDISVAAIVHWLDENPARAVCIDEVDVKRDADRDSAVAAICRNGYTPDKPYRRWDPAARRLDECPTYGAKALGYRSKVDDALEDRGFTLQTAEVRGRTGAELVRQNFFRDVADLPVELAAWGRGSTAAPSDTQLGAVLRREMASDHWLEKVEETVGPGNFGANRETQLTMVTLAVCRAACIDLTDSLQAAFGLRREVAAANSDEEIEEARDVLAEIVSRVGKLTREAGVYVVRQKDFVSALDARRKEKGLRPITSIQVAKLRNDLGIRSTWLTHPKNRATWNIPEREGDALLERGAANLPNPPNPFVLDGEVSQVSQVSPPPRDRLPTEVAADPGDVFGGRETRADRARAAQREERS